MDRSITGYHQDESHDWVAELSCGHNQHVRHRPPFQDRAWVLHEQGRAGRIGMPLSCPLCDRAELPADVRLARSSPEWNERTLPDGLRRPHRLTSGTWGRIVLREGCLRLTMATVPPLEVELAGDGAVQAIPPDIDHEVLPVGPVRFSVDFLAVERARAQANMERGKSRRAPSGQGGDPACWAGLLCPECGIVLDGSPHHLGCPLRASN